MKTLRIFTRLIFLSTIMVGSCNTTKNENMNDKPEYALVIHGGAGVILRENMNDELEQEYLTKMNEALDAGLEVLKAGGSSIEAVVKTINIMENSPLFNAGKGAVFTHDEKNELDASIMNGEDLNAGAISGVGNIKNPINLAREVMLNSEHVMLSGKGASEFAKEKGLELVDSSYFFTERRWKSLQKALKEANNGKFGTVGCAALDKSGNLAAGTSTGGMTNKKYGRIGDAPIIGAGTYANNNTCAISATGHGEFFIKYTVAHDISALMEYGGKTLEEASQIVINEKLVKAGGGGGIIGIDKNGNISMVFNTPGMYRGFAKSTGERELAIFQQEE